MGLIKIKKEMLDSLVKIYTGLDKSETYDGKDYNNMFMTSFIQLLIDRSFPVKAVPVMGDWLEVDRPEDLNVSCCIGEPSEVWRR